MVDIIRAYSNPQKYRTDLPMDSIVADKKIVEEGVSHYGTKLGDGQELKPIIVIKHPKEDIYAVLDGHHRFWALNRKGAETIPAVVVDSYVDLGFNMTKKGYFQPLPLFTEYVRIPVKRLRKYMKTFLEEPKKLLRKQ